MVENVQSSLGISHSIHLALEAASPQKAEEAAYCFAVCDQPYLKADTIEDLIEGWKTVREELAACVTWESSGIRRFLGYVQGGTDDASGDR